MDDQLTINDLPVECIDEILQCITDRVDRIYARFVCKLWCALIDQDCSAECYQIDVNRINFDSFYQHARPFNEQVYFSEICSIFNNSQRKKTTFKFKQVNFEGSEQFWKTKGKGIISLYFGIDCENIPLTEIVDHCSNLKTLTITPDCNYPYGEDRFIDVLKQCVAKGRRNFSVRFLYLKGELFKNMAEVFQLVSQVFLGIENVFFEDQDYRIEIDKELNSLSAVLKNFKFLISLSNGSETFIFDPSSKGPIRMTSLSIMYPSRDLVDILTNNQDNKYLNRLKIILLGGTCDYDLDSIQQLITQYPSLKSLSVTQMENKYNPLTNLLSKNNIEYLSLYRIPLGNHPLAINDAFLQSFENLKTFECPHLVFGDFVKMLRKFPFLEKLKMDEGTIDVDPVLEVLIIANERLLELKMPRLFLQKTILKYDFRNLKKLDLTDERTDTECRDFETLSLDFHEHLLKRVNCPKLEILCLDVDTPEKWNKNPDQTAQWIINILTIFPALTELLFSSCKLKINGKILKAIFAASRRKLRKIGDKRHPHVLNVLSPSLIQCRWEYGQRVLKI